MMETRRGFMQTAAGAALASQSVLGANDRVRVAIIGCGSRGMMDIRFFQTHADCELVAACDVRKSRLDAALGEMGGNITPYTDYRRVLDRNDIDAVVVATPDHWHGPITVDACEAGKDVYVEKPISNSIEAAQAMVDAAREYDRVIQCGLQQRSAEHFQEAAKMVQDGLLGKVTHAVLCMPGGYTQATAPPEPVPDDLDWEMFQGPAPRRPFSPSRLRWRAYYDYGGGLITDWGVHLTDTVHLFLDCDYSNGPLTATASGQYVNADVPERDQVPDAFVCSWKYDDFVMSFTNVVWPNRDWSFEGSYFYGPRGVLHIHRSGYRVLPLGGRGRRGETAPPPIEEKTLPVTEYYQNDPWTMAHARNFLDCIKSREKPISTIEIGFQSTLPCLLALLAVREGRTFSWDGREARPV